MAKKSDKNRGRRQAEIPGTEPPRIGEIDECALELLEIRDEIKELRAKEVEVEERLGLICGEHKVGDDKDHPYVFVGDDNEKLECYREIAKRHMRVRKPRRKRSDEARSEGGGPGALAPPASVIVEGGKIVEAPAKPGDFGELH